MVVPVKTIKLYLKFILPINPLLPNKSMNSDGETPDLFFCLSIWLPNI